MKLYLGNLAWIVMESEIETFFAAYGVRPGSCKVIKDRESGRSRGFGFIEVTRGEEAMMTLNGQELIGRPIRISPATVQQR